MSHAEELIRTIALAAMNLTDDEVDALESYGNLPDLGGAAEFTWWLRSLAGAERNRRSGEPVSLPFPSFDMMTGCELADSLVAATQVAVGTRERLFDVANPMLQVVALHAALRLKETEITRSN